MKSRLRLVVIALGICGSISPALAQTRTPLLSDGLLLLHGTLTEATTNDNALSFVFTGNLSFTFFTAPAKDPVRKAVDLKFEASKLPVTVPKFGRPEYSTNKSPFVVNFPVTHPRIVAAGFIALQGRRLPVAMCRVAPGCVVTR